MLYLVINQGYLYIQANSQDLERGNKSASKKRGGKNQPVKQGFIMDFCDLYYSLMILADKTALVWRWNYKKSQQWLTTTPRLYSKCIKSTLKLCKTLWKKQGEKISKNHGKGKNNQDRGRIFTPELFITLCYFTLINKLLNWIMNITIYEMLYHTINKWAI